MRLSFTRHLIKIASLAGFLFAGGVQADDQLMILFPKQRASHQEQMDAYSAHYLERGQAYVDHLYATGGEEPMEPDSLLVTELKDDPIETVPVDTAEVADLVKEAEEMGLVAEDGSVPTPASRAPHETSAKKDSENPMKGADTKESAPTTEPTDSVEASSEKEPPPAKARTP